MPGSWTYPKPPTWCPLEENKIRKEPVKEEPVKATTMERILVGELTGIKKIKDAEPGQCPLYEITLILASNPVRIDELKLGMQCAIEYKIQEVLPT